MRRKNKEGYIPDYFAKLEKGVDWVSGPQEGPPGPDPDAPPVSELGDIDKMPADIRELFQAVQIDPQRTSLIKKLGELSGLR